MPPFLVPRHVSAHRTSAIALYRALLQQTRAVPLPSQSQQELQNIVRNRCKQAIHLHSYQRLKLAFQAGYEAIDHLDAAIAGNEESTRFIAGLLARAPAGVKADPPVGLLLKNKTRGSKSEGTIASTSLAQALRPKPSTELLSRPLPLAQLSGKRHVPVLFNANHIPILRIKKPQPENLSGFIKHRIKQRQRRHDRRHWLVEQIEFAQYEDLWDDIVERETGLGDRYRSGEQDEPTWAEEFEISKAEVDKAIWEEGRKNAEMAARMQGVVDREREAFERERVERREAKRIERVERRIARDGGREEAG
jgi:hypothetical protein